MKTVLIIEDEQDVAELLSFNLQKEGFRAVTAPDGLAGLDAARSEHPDLILLDLMLPGLGGMDVCKALKSGAKTALIPVVLLTAKGEEIDRVVGFELGADDYVVKPFSIRELLLRVKAVLRRIDSGAPAATVIRVGAVVIDAARHMVTVEGAELVLTTTEFKLLHTLAERLGRLQSREQLLKDVWGYNYAGDTRTVDTHVTRLRTKLGDAGSMIRTVRGFGYKMEPA